MSAKTEMDTRKKKENDQQKVHPAKKRANIRF